MLSKRLKFWMLKEPIDLEVLLNSNRMTTEGQREQSAKPHPPFCHRDGFIMFPLPGFVTLPFKQT